MGEISTSPRYVIDINGSALFGGVGGINYKKLEKMRYF